MQDEENKINSKLEDLGNSKLKRELLGYNPSDIELQNKLLILEQVFNGKNEIFLKKEVILEELVDMVANFKE